MDKSALDPAPAAILKAIRDKRATTVKALIGLFGDDYYVRHPVLRTVRELERANVILKEGSTLSVTENWINIQDAMHLSLTALVEMEGKGAMVTKPEFGLPDKKRSVHDVFVLMPFSDDLKAIYTTHISRVAKSIGLTVARADDFFTAHAVMKDVWTAICGARVLVADCTGRNPNVFYEIGMAHTVGKPVILITQKEDDVPFDLRHLRYIKYAYTPPGMEAFEKTLTSTIGEVLSLPDQAI